MTPTEAGELLAYAGAYDNRKPSIVAAKAWAAALHDVPLDRDTLAAVARYYGMPGDNPGEKRWIQPHHVRYHRTQIRGERIAAANVLYDGLPGETGEQSIASRRELLRAAGDGALPPRPIRAALEPGQTTAEPSDRVHAILAAVGQYVPTLHEGVINVLAVRCPHCYARPGRTCTTGTRRRHRSDAHPARYEDARRAAAGLPFADQAEAEREIDRRRAAARAALTLAGTPIAEPDDDFDPWYRTKTARTEAAAGSAEDAS